MGPPSHHGEAGLRPSAQMGSGSSCSEARSCHHLTRTSGAGLLQLPFALELELWKEGSRESACVLRDLPPPPVPQGPVCRWGGRQGLWPTRERVPSALCFMASRPSPAAVVTGTHFEPLDLGDRSPE